eukprot:gnl/Spiro4/29805_TR14647_c0_g1_i1.p2 gnl/Spiro4/29805_TR14647_c0_g1~~gnl/Spiro4/29805_TR14647_c0_g1_i1.p2  ORF type:complete len:112 (-),score=30.14 gnl/Spiro4/29805_TR14647_c0_g1_i1:68-403(-)
MQHINDEELNCMFCNSSDMDSSRFKEMLYDAASALSTSNRSELLPDTFLRSIFEKFQTNGRITANSLQQAMLALGRPTFSLEEARCMISAAQPAQPDTVTFDEFAKVAFPQ